MKIIVKAKVNGINLDIPVGEGKQTFKWLGLAIQTRLNESKLLRDSYGEDYNKVNEIRNNNNELINPKDFIYEHADGSILNIIVTVISSYKSDDMGNPIINEWSGEAYISNKISKKWLNEIRKWRNKSETSNKEKEEFGFITIGDIFTEKESLNAFQFDWNQIKWTDWIDQPFTEETESNLKYLLRDNYSIICNLYSHYCGPGQVGQRYGMTLQEFSHLLHMSKLCDISDKQTIDLIFKKPINNSKSTILMTRTHFTQSIVVLALNRGKMTTIINVLNAIIKVSLLQFWNKLCNNYYIYQSNDPTMRLALREHFHLIKPIYLTYAKNNLLGSSSLFLSDFISILSKANIITSDQEACCVSAFSHVQLNPLLHDELKELVYIEFLEGIAKVASLTINTTNGINDAKKFRIALNLVLNSQRSFDEDSLMLTQSKYK